MVLPRTAAHARDGARVEGPASGRTRSSATAPAPTTRRTRRWSRSTASRRRSSEVRAGRTKSWNDFKVPEEAVSVGFHEAARGVLSHHMVIREGKIANYQPYPPTPWNANPRDVYGTPGPYEDAVQNTPIFEENGPDKFKGIDIMRAVRSFDPCLPCGVHMYLGGGQGQEGGAHADGARVSGRGVETQRSRPSGEASSSASRSWPSGSSRSTTRGARRSPTSCSARCSSSYGDGPRADLRRARRRRPGARRARGADRGRRRREPAPDPRPLPRALETRVAGGARQGAAVPGLARRRRRARRHRGRRRAAAADGQLRRLRRLRVDARARDHAGARGGRARPRAGSRSRASSSRRARAPSMGGCRCRWRGAAPAAALDRRAGLGALAGRRARGGSTSTAPRLWSPTSAAAARLPRRVRGLRRRRSTAARSTAACSRARPASGASTCRSRAARSAARRCSSCRCRCWSRTAPAAWRSAAGGRVPEPAPRARAAARLRGCAACARDRRPRPRRGGPEERCDLCGAALPGRPPPPAAPRGARDRLRLRDAAARCAAATPPTGRRASASSGCRSSTSPTSSGPRFAIPIGLAFFLRARRGGEVVALYPSPAGATECELDLRRWERLVARTRCSADLEPDAEALVVDRLGAPPPLRDRADRPVLPARRPDPPAWAGISGGDGVARGGRRASSPSCRPGCAT